MAILGYNVKDAADTSGMSAGRMYVSKYTLAVASTLSELHGWFGVGSGSVTTRIVIYADSAGSPGARLAYTNILTVPGGSGAGIELSQTGFSVSLAAGDYWIGFECVTNPGSVDAYAGTGGTHKGKTGGSADPPPDPFGSTDTSGTRKHSCWAVVTAAPTSTVARFSRLKLGTGLAGTDQGSGVIKVDATAISTFVSGTGAPSVGTGVNGAIYLDTASGKMYGPKAAGAWPATPFGRLLLPGNTYTDVTAKYGNYAALLAG